MDSWVKWIKFQWKCFKTKVTNYTPDIWGSFPSRVEHWSWWNLLHVILRLGEECLGKWGLWEFIAASPCAAGKGSKGCRCFLHRKCESSSLSRQQVQFSKPVEGLTNCTQILNITGRPSNCVSLIFPLMFAGIVQKGVSGVHSHQMWLGCVP